MLDFGMIISLPFPYDDSAIAVINLPKGIVEPAAEGKIDISALYNDSIIHEWTSFTGRILFRKFKSRFKEVICSKEGPYEKFIKGQVSVAGLPSAMVLNVYANGVSNETFLVPILLFFSVLLIKEGIEKYCKVQVI